MEGWIKIHRDIKEHWIYEDPKFLKWWVSILLNVNHKAKNIPVGSELIECGPGQSFMSIETWTSTFGCSKKTTIKFFETLQNHEMIKCKTIGKGNRRKHLLTVVNWLKYQVEETGIYTERVPEFTPKGNPNVTPNKNDNNEKNNLSVIFEKFRKSYPGTKRGYEMEFKNFLKKNKPEIVSLLMPALEKEMEYRAKCTEAKRFVPEWKNLQTWINQKCWEQEFQEIKTPGMLIAKEEVKIYDTPNEW